MTVLLSSGDCFKTVVCNCSSLIFDKSGLKTNELFKEAFKIHLDNESENLPYKYH